MARRLFFLIFIIGSFGLSIVVAQSKNEDPRRDRIKIVNVTSVKPVKDGVSNEFTVDIEYFIDSVDEATISIGFNTDDPGRFRMTAQKKVSSGAKVITLKARITPKEWKEWGDFMINAIIAPYPTTGGGFRPLATATRVIEFEP